mmetsp:Transcript_27846/g.64660  ORF Transcript_27846/g.64660 Transcript_27846/m.64660 type:complete len:212 (+) Transcript_27846:106-741(+)
MTIANHDDSMDDDEPVVVDTDQEAAPRVEFEAGTKFDRHNAELQKMLSSVRRHGPIPGDDEFDENNAPVRFVINEWAQGTSIHGVPYVTDSIQWRLWKRGTWICLVLVSAAFMLWQITQLITQCKCLYIYITVFDDYNDDGALLAGRQCREWIRLRTSKLLSPMPVFSRIPDRNFDVLTDTQTINPVSLHFPEVRLTRYCGRLDSYPQNNP